MNFKEINVKKRVYNYCFDYLIKAKMLEPETILINEKNFKTLVIYFSRYDHGRSMTMLSLYVHELVEKIELYDGEK